MAGAEMSAPIARVTVHTNGALVVRRLQAGPGVVEVHDLPLLYASDSLRVRAAGGQVRDVEETCTLVSAEKPPPPDEAALERLAHEDARLRDRLSSLDALARAWEGLLPGDPGERPPEGLPDADPWLAAWASSSERLEALGDEIARVKQERKDKARERARLELKSQGDVAPPRFSRGVRFVVDGDEARELELEYFVAGARWVPSYNLDLQGGRARLALSALVAQATGEDWGGAELRLSTADLARESTLPELTSWRIGRAQAPRRPAFRPLPDDLGTLFAGWERDRGRHKPPPPSGGKPSGGVSVRHAPAKPAASTGFEDERTAEWDVDRAQASLGHREEEVGLSAELEDDDLGDFDDDTGHMMMDEMAGGAPPAPMAAMAPMAESAAMPEMSRSRAAAAPRRKMKKQKAAMAPGAFGGAPADDAAPVVQAAPEPLPPRLRYAYLRVAGPDEAGRGALRAVDPLEHLYSLVDDHESASLTDLRRAVEALRAAASRVTGRRPPSGARAPDGASFHHVFTAAGAHDVPTDGSWHRVVVERTEADAQIDFRCVPREADDVYRFCTLAAPPGSPLLPGPLHVYEDGAFRVTSQVDASAGGAEIRLNLGAEPAVRIEGRTADIAQQEKGLVSQTSRVAHDVKVRLRSSLAQPARLVLYERLPVPGHNEKDVDVKLTAASPQPVRDDTDARGAPLRGGMRFEVDLAPGEATEVLYSYEITLPAKSELVGGNRRE
jgi:hypothetical protein